jgi:hypothetical protein
MSPSVLNLVSRRNRHGDMSVKRVDEPQVHHDIMGFPLTPDVVCFHTIPGKRAFATTKAAVFGKTPSNRTRRALHLCLPATSGSERGDS